MSDASPINHFQAEKQVIQQGDNNTQIVNFKTEIRYGDDSEEESYKNFNFKASSPYQGLAQFTATDSSRFYGRNKLIEDLYNNSKENNLLILLGASGSGKSSLVQAGLIPKFSNENKKDFVYFYLVPNQSPFYSFYGQIIAFVSTNTNYYKQSDAQIALPPSKIDTDEDLQNALNLLVKVVTTLKKNPDSVWLIFIDQFEEIFTRTSEFERGLFIQSLSNLINHLKNSNDKSVKVVLAMRTDFLDRLMNEFPDFVAAIQNEGKEPFSYITPMTDRELKLVIKNPAASHGVNVDKDLIEEIINDFRGESRSLPLLQYTLDLLWKNDDLSDRLLNQKTYEDLGRVGGALQQQAEKIYQHFDNQGQSQAIAYIFIKLVTITGDSKRVSKRENKSRFIGEVLETIVDELIKEHRLLISGRQPDTIEIAHEALINSWSRLQGWIDTHEEAIVLERQLKESAQSWEKATNNPDKASSELWRGSKLERVFELRIFGFTQTNFNSDLAASDFKKTVEDFVKASIELRDREKREKDEQIAKLNQALTETSLREKSARILNLLPTQPLDALILAIQAMGENLDKLPQKILTPVQSSLNIVMERARVPLCFEGYQHDVNAVDFSFQSQRIVGGSNSGIISLWDLQGNLISQFDKSHDSWIAKVLFSSDGQKIISVYGDGTLGLCNLQGSLIGKPFRVHPEGIRVIAFNPDHDRIVSSGIISVDSDRSLYLWDLQGNLICNLLDETNENWAELVIFSPDGQIIIGSISENKSRKLCLWDLQGNLIDEFFYDAERQIMSFSISPDSQMIVTGNLDGTLCLWNLQDKSDSKIFQQDGGSIGSLAFSPDGQLIVTGSWDGTLHLWDLQGNSIGQPFRGHQESVESVIFSPDSQIIASGSRDKTICLWDLKGNLINQPLRGHNNWVTSVAFSPDAKLLVSQDVHGTLYFWDLQGNAINRPFRGHKNLVTSVAFNSDGQQIVSGSADKTLILWNLQGEQITKPFVGHETGVESVAFSADGQRIVSGGWGWDGKIRLWNLQGDEITKSSVLEDTPKHENSASSVSFSPDGKIISAGVDGIIHLWDFEGNHICQLPEKHQGAINSVAFSPDGKKIISGGWYTVLNLWDSEGNHICQLPEEHQGEINSVAFSPDGQMIVSGERRRNIGLWDVQNNCIIRLFIAHESDVTSVAFRSDGQMIVSGGMDGTIRLWDLEGNPIIQPIQADQFSIRAVAFSPNGQFVVGVGGGVDGTIRLWRSHWREWLQVCCDRLRHHPVFKNPQTDIEQQAKATAEKYIFNPQIGAKELYDKALQRVKEKDFTTAITLLHRAISCHPVYTQAYYQRGITYYQVKRYFDAIKDFNQVLTKHPNIAEAYHSRGLCYRQVNNLEKAKADWQKAIQLYQQQGKQKEAQQIQQYLSE
ncbi:tetratricopeptide repeat protein [Nostoc sp. TCL26-01]|uniref:nSTAND1 domain-containing NTPase n=1 Tax=Nostoc sp. TCL26-01 TaxID=2576904 RepID=UPI0015BDBEDB|nr:tetratricopeptide repeat protein [Nostoc sp. TCL26-01]QLE57848.1 tetratricopeptide repeat protein [Nostoc sp. TCL26-01]